MTDAAADLRPGDDPGRPRYHFTAASGWINDPNGVGFHGGRYHLFYQFNPAAPCWGDIHWGHASSADLLHWRDEPVALRPGPGVDENGCFSGSYALVDGVPTLYYTANDRHFHQVQTCATSTDMRVFTKHPERTIVDPPPGVGRTDFRDPYVFRHGAFWYMVVGASIRSERGQCLLYRSADGIAWEYRHPLHTAPGLSQGVLWECPNFFPVGDRWVLTVSVWPNLSALWFSGRFEDERFVPEADGMLDVDGGAFAHLAMRAPDGRTLQWAWINEQRDAARIDPGGWAGALTVPRELALAPDGILLQRPAVELERLRDGPAGVVRTGTARGVVATFSGRCLDIEAVFTRRDRQRCGLTLLAAPDGSESTRVLFWPDARRLVVERARSSSDRLVSHQNLHALLVLDDREPLRLRVLLDHSVLEVYANDRVCLTTRVHPAHPEAAGGTAFVDGDADCALQVWRMSGLRAG